MKYDTLSRQLCERIERDRINAALPQVRFNDSDLVRRRSGSDEPTLWRPGFVRDIEKIMHSLYFNRYADKTQVFSFHRNDDITRRSFHVQLVSRIARTIGGVLNLNLDLIEAIALGHDIGHTPFGHAGEAILSRLYHARTGRYFTHNAHGVRVLDGMVPYNISLQTLNGILCHNGEFEMREYRPRPMTCFAALDEALEKCETGECGGESLVPSTLEGCLVRICDMIAYLGKDRQDAVRTGLVADDSGFSNGAIGSLNAEIINNLTVNIIENSYGQEYIRLDDIHFRALSDVKKENYDRIYKNDDVRQLFDSVVAPMMEELYEYLLGEVKCMREESVIFRHHVRLIEQSRYERKFPYREEEPDRIVTDYIASMTDDYFVELYAHLFPESGRHIEYIGYF
jgi:dGTPase